MGHPHTGVSAGGIPWAREVAPSVVGASSPLRAKRAVAAGKRSVKCACKAHAIERETRPAATAVFRAASTSPTSSPTFPPGDSLGGGFPGRGKWHRVWLAPHPRSVKKGRWLRESVLKTYLRIFAFKRENIQRSSELAQRRWIYRYSQRGLGFLS